MIDRDGLHVDIDKVRPMLEIPQPSNIAGVRRLLGMFSWYRRLLPNFATMVAPVVDLIKKNCRFKWRTDCDTAFIRIKAKLVKAPVLSCPDYSLPFEIHTVASWLGHQKGDRVICYSSRSLNRQERNFSTIESEYLAVLWAVEKTEALYRRGIVYSRDGPLFIGVATEFEKAYE